MTSAPEELLRGVRVLDFTQVLSGPFATMLMADAGAEVVKVERPGRGDVTRQWGPPFYHGESLYFLAFNRGKRSIDLDLGNPNDAAVARGLADASDVVIENLRPGTLDRCNLGADACRARNPRLIYVSIAGYAANGPRARDPALEVMLEAETGLMAITGPPDGQQPTRLGVAAIDMMAGMNAVAAVFAALYQRARTGEGTHVVVTLEEAAAVMMTHPWWLALVGGVTYPPSGSGHPNIAPYEAFATRDRPILCGAVTDEEFVRLCRIVERPEWAHVREWATNADRVRHRDALHAALEARFRARSAEEWERALRSARLPVAVVRPMREAAEQWYNSSAPRVTAHTRPGDHWAWPTMGWLTTRSHTQEPPRLGADRAAILQDWGQPTHPGPVGSE